MAKRAVFLVFAACTSGAGDDPGGGEPGGPDVSFTARDTISARITVNEDGDTAARIVIASTDQLCGDARATPVIERQQQKFITIDLHDVDGATTAAPTAPSTYTIYANTGSRPARSASLETGARDASCAVDQDVLAIGHSGTVTLTMVSGDKFAGAFDVVLNTDERITGSFDPTPCPELSVALASAAEPACQP